MLKRWILVLGLLFPLLACAANTKIKPFSWRYGTGSNIDVTKNTKTEFYLRGKQVYADPLAGGGAGGLLADRIKAQRYYWAGGGGLPTDGVPIPDKAVIEMVSFHDRKRYRIKVDLPANMEQQMRQVYSVEGRYDRRSWLYFGLAPGGYFEVLLKGDRLNVKPDILLARGIAEVVTDDWYDKKVAIERQYGMDDFDKKYGDLFKQYPVPNGMDWAPIMDAYRAAQPKTDTDPVN
ncbi:hypothetical protein AO721_17175 [Aeromonas veronii]|uniref:DUF2931 family protein n=1 Tax=Aeromonas veronii TaxID=654 RepID=UPI0007187D15|nr:DUF2931 family protein [Aeromonas veronii]KRV69209.1 hypothetical protein AO728_12415 [Aeromonas veronii]KRV70986.1 hypothetical protein AO719_11160 [Aeromonas veronii]KRV88058.1 hypothetical protein AO721_17175 [Aeromonas veronii]KRV90371.1 hypothetical protein AO739_13730 [Aeromonas veronii]